jgi:hypothetical protein
MISGNPTVASEPSLEQLGLFDSCFNVIGVN